MTVADVQPLLHLGFGKSRLVKGGRRRDIEGARGGAGVRNGEREERGKTPRCLSEVFDHQNMCTKSAKLVYLYLRWSDQGPKHFRISRHAHHKLSRIAVTRADP